VEASADITVRISLRLAAFAVALPAAYALVRLRRAPRAADILLAAGIFTGAAAAEAAAFVAPGGSSLVPAAGWLVVALVLAAALVVLRAGRGTAVALAAVAVILKALFTFMLLELYAVLVQ